MKLNKNITIAIDGFSSCGKSTLAKEIAKQLNYKYIDSGAMYRSVTLLAIRNNLIDGIHVDEKALLEILNNIQIDFIKNKKTKKQETYLNGENIEDEIRDIDVSDQVSIISKIKIVRDKLVYLQRKVGIDKCIVMDGRDIGTVVFPDAELKIFMTASEDIRAKRRYKELIDNKKEVRLNDIIVNIQKRDLLDQTREESPLRKADDAVVLDNSELNRKQQLVWVMDLLDEKFNQEN